MPIRKHKKYNRPRKIFDIALMKEEGGLIKRYGLKSRREVWKADFEIGKIRNLAKKLIAGSDKDKEEFIARQRAKGFNVNNIAEVLGLNKEDRLKRRLQSILVSKGLVRTHKQARQLITHKHVKINGKIISAPRHLMTLDQEQNVELTLALPEKKTMSDEEKSFLANMHKADNAEEKAEEAK